MRKVILVIANASWLNGMPLTEPLVAVPILAAELSGNFDYEILDCNGNNYSEAECYEKLKNSQAEAVLLTALFLQYHKQYARVMELAKTALPNAFTVMGGTYPTSFFDKLMEDKNVDYAFLGYAEGRLSNFLNMVFENQNLSDFAGVCYRNSKGGVTVQPIHTYIGDVKKLHSPDYSKVDLTPYLNSGFTYSHYKREVTIMTSFGCPHNCVFCANRALRGSKVAYRDIEDVITELKYLKDKYNIDHIRFADDHILTKRERAEYLFNRMIEENLNMTFWLQGFAESLDEEILDLMVKAGCVEINISLESGCDRVLHQIIHKPIRKMQVPKVVKLCNDRNIFTRLCIVIGFPGETWNEIRESIAFAESCNADYVTIYIATVFPMTDLYKLAKKTNTLPDDFDFFDERFFNTSAGFITTNEFTPLELEILRSFEWDRINFSTESKRKRYCELKGFDEKALDNFRKDARLNIGKSWGMRKFDRKN